MERIKKVLPTSDRYPVNLKEIVGFPKMLYVWGEILPSDARAVAVVGTRKMTCDGRKKVEEFCRAFAGAGVTVVSGGARGVDTWAHRAALDAHGRTIAVLGSGIDVVYPPENEKLFTEISQSGAVVSEFPPGTKPLGKNFLVRNRIISGLSCAVLVVEGKRKSGTISTATHAANQGREVFAVPGSEASDWLIENGANVAIDPKDILQCLGSL